MFIKTPAKFGLLDIDYYDPQRGFFIWHDSNELNVNPWANVAVNYYMGPEIGNGLNIDGEISNRPTYGLSLSGIIFNGHDTYVVSVQQNFEYSLYWWLWASQTGSNCKWILSRGLGIGTRESETFQGSGIYEGDEWYESEDTQQGQSAFYKLIGKYRPRGSAYDPNYVAGSTSISISAKPINGWFKPRWSTVPGTSSEESILGVYTPCEGSNLTEGYPHNQYVGLMKANAALTFGVNDRDMEPAGVFFLQTMDEYPASTPTQHNWGKPIFNGTIYQRYFFAGAGNYSSWSFQLWWDRYSQTPKWIISPKAGEKSAALGYWQSDNLLGEYTRVFTPQPEIQPTAQQPFVYIGYHKYFPGTFWSPDAFSMTPSADRPYRAMFLSATDLTKASWTDENGDVHEYELVINEYTFRDHGATWVRYFGPEPEKFTLSLNTFIDGDNVTPIFYAQVPVWL